MKKIVLILIVILLTGCHNIPSGEVNSYLNSYKSLDPKVMNSVEQIINDSSFNGETNSLYKKAYIRQYQDMDFQILDYNCKKKTCDIPVTIEVYDYSSIQEVALNYLINNEELFENENHNYDINLYEQYKLNLMLNTTTRIKYTINFHLEKNLFNWEITNLENADLLKIHGIYE